MSCKYQSTEVQSELLHFLCPSHVFFFFFCSATNRRKQNLRAASFHIIRSARKCPLRSCFLWRTDQNFKPWKKSSVGSSNGIVINASTQWSFTRGACMYAQCKPFLLWCRWHHKKKKKKKKRGRLCKHQKQTHKQWWPSESPIHLFSCWVLVVSRRSRRFHWCLDAVVHALFGYLLKCKCTLF